jgi:hypothetical protein
MTGWGVATEGDYMLSIGRWKTFGSVGQGKILSAVKDNGENDCEKRQMFVTIYAYKDFEDDQYATLNFRSVKFDPSITGPVISSEPLISSGTLISSGISLQLSLIFVFTSMLLSVS